MKFRQHTLKVVKQALEKNHKIIVQIGVFYNNTCYNICWFISLLATFVDRELTSDTGCHKLLDW